MVTIGITGGVGCGKSAVLKYLRENYDCVILETDALAKEMQQPSGPLYAPVLALLCEAGGIANSEDLLLADRRIDTTRMAQLIFADPQLLEKINALIHPAVIDEVRERIRAAGEGENAPEFFFVESALLIESRLGDILEDLWYIYCPEDTRRMRLRANRGYSDGKIDAIMAAQKPEEAFRRACTHVIDNGGSREETARNIDAVIRAARAERREAKEEAVPAAPAL